MGPHLSVQAPQGTAPRVHSGSVSRSIAKTRFIASASDDFFSVRNVTPWGDGVRSSAWDALGRIEAQSIGMAGSMKNSLRDAATTTWGSRVDADVAPAGFFPSHCFGQLAGIGEGLPEDASAPTQFVPGTVFVCGRRRLLTAKSSMPSEPSTSHPRTSSAHATVITDERCTPTPATTRGSRQRRKGPRAGV